MHASHELKTRHLLVYIVFYFYFLMVVSDFLLLSAEQHNL